MRNPFQRPFWWYTVPKEFRRLVRFINGKVIPILKENIGDPLVRFLDPVVSFIAPVGNFVWYCLCEVRNFVSYCLSEYVGPFVSKHILKIILSVRIFVFLVIVYFLLKWMYFFRKEILKTLKEIYWHLTHPFG
jgi:hypothetical protein